MPHRWNRNASIVIAVSGACVNAVLATKVFSLWRTLKWETESEWEGSVDLWTTNSVRVVGALALAYFATAAVASTVGFIGILKGIPPFVRFYRDYYVADFSFCALTTLVVTYASFRYYIVRTSLCEELSRHTDFMRDLAEMGLNTENCEQWFERVVVAFVVFMVIIIAFRLHFAMAISNHYAQMSRFSSGLLPAYTSRPHKETLQRIFLLPSPTSSTPGGSPTSSQQNLIPVVYAPIPLSELSERDAKELNAREAWIHTADSERASTRQHRHSQSRSHRHHGTGRIGLPIRADEGTHPRSPSPDPDAAIIKRLKIAHQDPPADDPTALFATNLFDPAHVHRLNSSYVSAEPFKYVLVEKLFQDDLLQHVKDECLSELHFTEKETDIYKVNQTGDLKSLSYLTEHQISLLPNILKLRDALYSTTFRRFLRTVTGCGPLSGEKQDMSVNTYRKGCHLLNHDDVIGSRRVSYILYMPLPHFQMWQKDWGGALEFYPVREGENGVLEPEPIPAKSISPSWNQFIFFEVQPGRSFHSVEEVVVGEGEDGRQRLSISGWFHAAQPGEDGYEPEADQPDVPSSREQLASTSTNFKPFSTTEDPPLPDSQLTEDHISFLSEFMNPVYLQHRTMKALASRFVEESSLELHDFLCGPIADKLNTGLYDQDVRDGLGKSRGGKIPPHTAGTGNGWIVKGPPHKWRYNVLEPLKEGGPAEAVSPRAAQTPDRIIRSLQDELFTSPAYRAWLAVVSQMLPLRHAVEARRFCPGLGYTLATSEAKEARLDVVLGLTPSVNASAADESADGNEDEMDDAEDPQGWQTGEWGGWECYMAPHEEGDPAVYRSGPANKSKQAPPNGRHSPPAYSNGAGHGHRRSGSGNSHDPDAMGEDDEDDDGVPAEEEEEDGTLLTVQPGFNRLLLVLRDEGVMHFVKYVSAAAAGSRWDVCGEYEVGIVEEEEDE
ncbi:hypothetical protein BV25DRAFT_1833867 [Artomyces pyxidatus]|uniref:Uncharacterized protein n=1 Tax=Artomyces pyxidatus TaxID=48021 RepID=A0ACB8TJN5_9AGAM|nr:hypothetical protein BV25DRAFT_1833867 [Artomyces pyxidatus]